MTCAPSPLLPLPILACFALSACAGGAPPDEGQGRRVDLLSFAHDTPAVGDRWYAYDGSTHVLTPKDERYVVREGEGDAVRFAALRLVSYYDPDTAVSGRFTVEHARFEAGDWSEAREHLTSANVKSGGPLCLDLFSASLEVGCDDGDWQVQLATAPFLVVEGPLVVQSPAVRFRDGSDPVHVATVPGVGLSDLPAPDTFRELDDAAPEGWSTPSWDRARLSRDLPRAGRWLGSRFVDEGHSARDDVYFLVGAGRVLVRLALAPEVEGDEGSGVRLRFAVAPLDFADGSAGDFGEAREHLLTPDDGRTLYLGFSLEGDGLVVEDAATEGPSPSAATWDLALTYDDGAPSFALSSAAAMFNHTAAGGEDASAFDDALPRPARE